MAENVECPSCQHSWSASEADLGLQKCPACNADIEVVDEVAEILRRCSRAAQKWRDATFT